MTPMTEQIQDQLSAFIDDELSAEECAFFVRRLQRDPESAQRALRFATIGAALRGELVQPDPGLLLRRIDAALDGKLVEAPVRKAAAPGAYLRPAFGVAISAGVAAAALLLLRSVNMAGGDSGAAPGSPAQAWQATQRVEPATYVVPREPASNQMITMPTIRLTNYLMHHGEYTSRLGRTMVNSNVVVSVDEAIELEQAPPGGLTEPEDGAAAPQEPAE